jgi:hypothetical protein
VEEFRLVGFGARQELDIVDEQHADVQVAAAEVVLLAVPGRDRELAAEFRGTYVADVQRWVPLPVYRDGLGHQALDADSCNQPSRSLVMHPGNHISNPP